MDSRQWEEMLNARRGASQTQSERAPLPPDASEAERFVCEHSTHPGFRAIAEVPEPDMALMRCKHIGELGEDLLVPVGEAQELCRRYGVKLIPRDKWAPGRRPTE